MSYTCMMYAPLLNHMLGQYFSLILSLVFYLANWSAMGATEFNSIKEFNKVLCGSWTLPDNLEIVI